jgi:hypothetical protein
VILLANNEDVFRLRFEADDGGIRATSDALDDVEVKAGEAEESVRGFGAQVDTLGTQSKKLGITWGDVGKEFGKKFGTPFDNFFKSAKTKIKDFGKNFGDGLKKIGTAARHPIQTLKDGLFEALTRNKTRFRETAEEADKLGKEAEDAGKKGADGFGKLANVLKVIVAGELAKKVFAGIGKLVSSGITQFEQMAGNVASINATLGTKLGESASKWADEYAAAANRSKAEVKGFVAENAAVAKSLGMNQKAAADFAESTTALGYDLAKSFNVKDDAEMMTALNAAIGGQADAMAKYGVVLDDATLKQTALGMGIKGEIGDLSDAQAAQVRYAAVLNQTKNAQGEMFKSTGSITDAMKGLKAIGSNVIGMIGEKAAPLISKLMGTLSDLVPKVMPAIEGLVDVLVGGLGEAVPVISELATDLIPVLADTIGGVFTAIKPLIPVILDLVKKLLPPIMQVVTTLLNQLLPPLAAVIEVLIPPIADICQQLLPPLLDVVDALIPPLMEVIQQILPPIVDIIKVLIPPVAKLIQSLLPPLMTVIKALLPPFTKIAEAILPPILELVTALLPVLDAVTPIITLFANILAKVVGFVADLAGGIAKIGGKVIDGIAKMFGGGKGSSDDAPHNATGTPSFGGGWTHINERGGEMAFLPQGSAIIPADKSQQVADAMVGTARGSTSKVINNAVNINLNVNGNADQSTIEKIYAVAKKAAQDALEEANAKAFNDEMIQGAYLVPA